MGLWNTTCIAKLVWDIVKKKDNLWVQWIHGRYIRDGSWWEYTSRSDASWYWQKLLKVRDKFRTYPKAVYKVEEGYAWLLQADSKPPWAKMIWTRISLPRHSLTAWMFMHQKLPVLQRLGRYTHLQNTICGMCQQFTETHAHVFF